MTTRAPTVLLTTAALLACLALASWALPQLGGSEKPGAVYLLRHWIDVPWQLGMPLGTAAGISLLLGLLLLAKARRRAGCRCDRDHSPVVPAPIRRSPSTGALGKRPNQGDSEVE